jgi:hypothetical protein
VNSRARCCALLGGAVLLGASPVRAEGPTKLECVSANEAGQVLVQSGKPVEAERKLATCMAASCPVPVRQDCAQRLLAVGRAIPTLVFDWQDGAGNAVRPTRVTMDGQPLPDALGGKPVRLDPGEHRFSFAADGMSGVEKTFTLREGEKGRRETVVFAPASSGSPAAAGHAAEEARERPSPDERRTDEERPSSSSGSSGAPTLVYLAGSAGVAGLALGIGAGLAASSHNSALQSECHGNVCPSSAQSDIDAFRTWRDWSTAGYVLAGVGLVGGVVFWLTAPRTSARDTAAQLWIGPRGAGLAGSF